MSFPTRRLLFALAACAALPVIAGDKVAGTLRVPSAAAPRLVALADAGDGTRSVPATFKDIQPLLAKYCFECHRGGKAKAGVQLDLFKDEAAALRDRLLWEKVLQNIQSEAMPPEGKPQPTDAERELLARWIETRILKLDCSGPVDPGRVTIRRLNRVEYNNTIRDLVGVDFRPADDFPTDDIGYGFDNIGDVLSLPPILLEKYIAAAEKIVETAIATPDADRAPVKKVSNRDLRSTSGGRRQVSHNLNSNGELYADVEFPKTGEYLLRARAFGQQAGDEPARMKFRLDDKDLRTVDVKAEEDSPQNYETRLKIDGGKHKFAVAFINDYYNEKDPNPKNRDRNLIVESLEVQGPIGELPDPLPASHTRIITCRPGEQTKAACARVILRSFASRAFRRPATDEEVERLVRFVEFAEKEGDSFERGIQLALQAVLVSPHFLYRVELDPNSADPQAVRTLNDWELATRLSYFLWSTMPDEELFRHAAQGTLRKEGNLETQVRRMLADPKAKALVENFAGQWLQLRNLKAIAPDKKQFPEFDDALRAAMRTETELFFEAIVREDRSVLDLLDADFTFVNERLARHYGLPDVKGDEFRKVTLAGGQRGGLLGHASILTVTSNPTRTSPVKRGKWILENLLGTPPPPPPPGVPELNEAKDKALTGTLRQRMEQHRSDPNCAACHQRMDPLGFGLENYNAIGGWRTTDGAFPIDPAGTLPGGQSFQSPAELRSILKGKQSEFRNCLTEMLLTYALGRGLEYNDKCTLDQISRELASRQNRFSALVFEIVKCDAFQKRRGKGNTP